MRVGNRSAGALAGESVVEALDDRSDWARGFVVRREARIAELTRATLEGTSVSDLMHAAVRFIGRDMADVDYVCVGQIAPTGLRRIAAFGVPDDEIPLMLEPDPSTYLAMRSVRAGECVVVTDWDTEVRFPEPAWLQLECVKSSALLPIRTYSRDHLFGFLGIHAKHSREFPQHEIVYLEIVANVLGKAIAHEQSQVEATQHLQQLQALAENSPDMISRFDRDLRIMYINGTVERLTGVSASKFVGRTLRDIRRMNESQVSAIELALRQVLRTGTPRTLDFEAPTVLGLRMFQTYVAPELDSDGRVQSVVLAARDITEHQRAHEQLLVIHSRVFAQLEVLHELVARSIAAHQQRLETVVVEGQLTPRERQILNLIARGWSNQEIAAALGVSRGTVKNQVSRLLEKLDVSDRTQAAAKAVRMGLVDEQ
jgi:PAS domain S-box-containing protein